jgi:hypothetical protein
MLWILPPALTKLDELNTRAIGAPYWWVKPTHAPEAATMVEVKIQVGPNSYLAFTNPKATKKFTRLMNLKPDIAAQPLKKAKTTRWSLYIAVATSFLSSQAGASSCMLRGDKQHGALSLLLVCLPAWSAEG